MTVSKLAVASVIVIGVMLGQDQPSLSVEGLRGTKAALSPADLSKLPRHTIKTTDHGTPATFEGVLLTDVLAKVELPAGEKFHKTSASHYVVIEAKDGYRAVFAWAELDSSFMDKPIYVVTERAGKALSQKDGPLQLVVPGEKRGARWVRQVIAIRIRQVTKE